MRSLLRRIMPLLRHYYNKKSVNNDSITFYATSMLPLLRHIIPSLLKRRLSYLLLHISDNFQSLELADTTQPPRSHTPPPRRPHAAPIPPQQHSNSCNTAATRGDRS